MTMITRSMTLLASSLLVVATCRAGSDRPGKAAIAQGDKISGLRPLSWMRADDQLLVMRVDMSISGDAGEVSCDSTGFYLYQESQQTRWKAGSKICELVSRLHGSPVYTNGTILLYADVFRKGGITELKLDDLSARDIPARCLPATSAPSLSPDGSRIAFVASCENANAHAFLHLANGDGSNSHGLPQGAAGFREDHPRWAPDGKRIVLVREAGNGSEIIVIDTATGVRHTVARGRDPAWSPKGEWIVYVQLDSTQSVALALKLVRPDGGQDHELYRFRGASATRGDSSWLPTPPIWSPNGNRIAFGDHASIWVMDLTDKEPRRLDGSVP